MPSVTRRGTSGRRKGSTTADKQSSARPSRRTRQVETNYEEESTDTESLPPPRSSPRKSAAAASSSRAFKRQHPSDSDTETDEVPKSRAKSSIGNDNSSSAQKTEDLESDSETEDEETVETSTARPSNNAAPLAGSSKRSTRSTRSSHGVQYVEETDNSSTEQVSATSDDDVAESSRQRGAKRSKKVETEEETDEDEVRVVPQRATKSRRRDPLYEADSEVETASESADSDDDVMEIADDDSDDEVSFKGSPPPSKKSKSGGKSPVLSTALDELSATLGKLKETYELKLKQKDDVIGRLENELKYKKEQLDDLQNLSHQNMELEARISHMLSSKDAYDEEVENAKKAKQVKEQKATLKAAVENTKEAVENTPKEKQLRQPKIANVENTLNDKHLKEASEKQQRPTRRDNHERKQSHAPTDDSDIESSESEYSVIEDDEVSEVVEDDEVSEVEVQPRAKRERRKPQDSEEVVAEEEGDVKKKTGRGRRKKKAAEPEEANIDTLFVSDDSADELDKKDKKKKTKKKKEEEEDKDTAEEVEGDDDSKSPGRHKIRKIMATKKITQETKIAARVEKERRERLKETRHYRVEEKNPKSKVKICTKLVLDHKDDKDKTPVVEVDPRLIKKLKIHQVEGVEFMWNCLIESLEKLKEGYSGSGCILAHCMGLGKTLSVITLVQTLMTSAKTRRHFRRCLVICPLNTVLNWKSEWKKWLARKNQPPVYELASSRNNQERCEELREWHREGGILILGYQLFRILVNSNTRSKKRKQIVEQTLLDPGPDIVVCDEGHMLKNDATAISKATNRVRTRRRIVLTGTPLQNNLIEYHCMVSFVKPSLLGTRREFSNRFVNPITNGQHADSTSRDVKIMKRRAHVLHEMLLGCVQRKDYSVITKLLPPKHEYVLSVRLSKIQMDLYQKYMDLNVMHDPLNPNRVISRGTTLFSDYQNLMRVWTHPWVLKLNEERAEKKGFTESDDDELESLLDASSDTEVEEATTTAESAAESDEGDEPPDKTYKPRKTRSRSDKGDKDKDEKGTKEEKNINGKTDKDVVTEESGEDDGKRKAKVIAGEVIKNWQSNSRGNKADEGVLDRKPEEAWWTSMVSDEHKTMVELSGKLVLLFEILRMAQSVGDKVLVFSQSLLSLDLIEDFLALKTEEAEKKKSPRKGSGVAFNKWIRDEDYFRMDGSTGAERRKQCTTDFNNVKKERLRLFLISTKAGGLGINLDTANRVIIFDASWNPSHDIQSIFRVYRFGQVKPVYVYRFLAQGTMEEKIYERQIMKEALSERVVDEHQLDRHFNQADLQELYRFSPERLDDPQNKDKPTPKIPEDLVLAELLSSQKDWIVGYHEHDSLLEKRPEEDLTEDERKAAWEEYERDKQGIIYGYGGFQMPGMNQMQGMSHMPMMPAPIQMPRNPPFTSYLRPPQPNPGVQVPALSGGSGPATFVPRTAPLGGAATDAVRNSTYMTQLPRVVQEIMKYNPTIKPEELQHRLQAFMGMQNRAQVPGFVVRQNTTNGPRTVLILPRLSDGAQQTATVVSQPGGAVAGAMGLVAGPPVSQITSRTVPNILRPGAAASTSRLDPTPAGSQPKSTTQ